MNYNSENFLERSSLTTRVPDGVGLIFVAVLHALIYIGLGVAAGHEDLSEQGDVCDGQPQGVDLGQSLLVGKRGHVTAQLLKRRVDTEHALALADVGGVALDAVRVMLVLMLVMMLMVCVMAGGEAARPELPPFLLLLLVLCSSAVQLRPRGARLQLRESELRFREHGLTPEGGPRRQFTCHSRAIKQQRVELRLKLKVGVYLTPEGEVCVCILVKVKQHVLHHCFITMSDRLTECVSYIDLLLLYVYWHSRVRR